MYILKNDNPLSEVTVSRNVWRETPEFNLFTDIYIKRMYIATFFIRAKNTRNNPNVHQKKIR